MATKRVLDETLSATRLGSTGNALEDVKVRVWEANAEIFLCLSGEKVEKLYVFSRSNWDALKLI